MSLTMIHIKERFQRQDSVTLEIDGILDQGAVPILRDLCERHLRGKRNVLLDFKGVVHITREGRGFLHEVEESIGIVNLPEFVRLERVH
jgi:hypothetical protein